MAETNCNGQWNREDDESKCRMMMRIRSITGVVSARKQRITALGLNTVKETNGASRERRVCSGAVTRVVWLM